MWIVIRFMENTLSRKRKKLLTFLHKKNLLNLNRSSPTLGSSI
ncbi:hypothetical protein NMS_2474 [Nonlabens marinus S1-08]|uniref:Uncharacterized protein n=1 Tax=Nonlabens marinus S1-08 TaxID=1454201 RepID=W8VWN2_9FLAO|nr:hypothetical protein NMS_2474 [Nonlabens marinus S1-08]